MNKTINLQEIIDGMEMQFEGMSTYLTSKQVKSFQYLMKISELQKRINQLIIYRIGSKKVLKQQLMFLRTLIITKNYQRNLKLMNMA